MKDVLHFIQLGKELEISMQEQVMYDVDDVLDDGATLTWHLMQAKVKRNQHPVITF